MSQAPRWPFCVLVATLLTALALSLQAQTWQLLPPSEWSDPYSPLFSDGLGNFLEGDPEAVDGPEAVLVRQEWDEEEQAFITVSSVDNEVLANFEATADPAAIEALFVSLGLEIVAAWYEPDLLDAETSMAWFHLEIGPQSPYFMNVQGLIDRLLLEPGVDLVEFNNLRELMVFPATDPDDPHFDAEVQIQNLKADQAWQTELGDSNPTGVVILDSGVDLDHEDLENQLYQHPTENHDMGILVARSKVKVGDPAELPAIGSLQTTLSPAMIWQHGTRVAGIVAAETDNGLGVAGLAPGAQILPCRIHLTNAGKFTDARLVKAVKTLKKQFPKSSFANLRVVNMSLGGPGKSTSLKKAIKKDQKANDRLYVAAAGNDGTNRKNFPAALGVVLGVTGAKRSGTGKDEPHETSNFCPCTTPFKTVFCGISGYFNWGMTTNADGGYDSFSGTSAAAPQISALAALIFSSDPDLTWSEVSDHIMEFTKGANHRVIESTVNGAKRCMQAVADFDEAVTEAQPPP